MAARFADDALVAATAFVRPARAGALQPLAWQAAINDSAARIARIVQAHGPASLGIVVSGWIDEEAAYAFGKLARFIGTPHIASTSQLGGAAAHAAWQAALGTLPQAPDEDDIAQAQTIFIAGANPALTQPRLFARIAAARAQGQRVIVADPRRTATAEFADLHLPLLPGTDVVLLHAMLHLLLWEGLADTAFLREHAQGFATLRDVVREFTPAHAAKVCGLPAEAIVQAARWFGESRSTLSIVGQGLNQAVSGADRIGSLINLHLAMGVTGGAGAGPRLLRGQPHHHHELGTHSARSIFDATQRGEVRALWIAGADPLQSLPDAGSVRTALAAAEWVLVQDRRRDSATAAFADMVLQPTVASGDDEWCIAAAVARALEAALASRAAPMFDWPNAEELAAERIAAAVLASAAHESVVPQRPSLIAPKWRPTAEVRDARHPISLLTGRGDGGEPRIEVHPQDMVRRRWKEGDIVRLASKRGELLLPVHGNERMLPAHAFVANGLAAQLVGAGSANVLTMPAACPRTRQAELKHAALRVEAQELPWQLAAAAWLPAGAVAAAQARLLEVLAPLRFASVVPLVVGAGPGGEEQISLVVRAAHGEPAPQLLADVEAALQIGADQVLRYADARAGRHRVMQIGADGTLRAFALGGDTAARGWILELLLERRSTTGLTRALLAGAAKGPGSTAPSAAAAVPAVIATPAPANPAEPTHA